MRPYQIRRDGRTATARKATLALLLPVALLSSLPLAAVTITVDGTTCTLTDAIIAANTDTATGGCPAGEVGADTLVLNADVTLTAADTTNSTLLFGDYAGLPTIASEIAIEGGLASVIERDGGFGCVEADPNAFRLLDVASAGHLTLSGLTLRHGCVTGGAGTSAWGGGVYLDGGRLTVTGSTFLDNAAIATVSGSGGAIAGNGPSEAWIDSSTFSANRARNSISTSISFGGAIHFREGQLRTLTGNTFDSNSVECSTVCYGGALSLYYNAHADTLTGNLFLNNSAVGLDTPTSGGSAYGGAVSMWNLASAGTFADNVFIGNQALGGAGDASYGGTAEGGGAWVGRITAFSNNLFSGNTARGGNSLSSSGGSSVGGGLYISGWQSTVSHVTAIGNTARGGDGATDGGDAWGGGVYGYPSTGSHGTISGNVAQGGDGGSGPGGDALGGGWIVPDDTVLNHLTITGNEARAGAGFPDGLATGGGLGCNDYTPVLGASIVADNTALPAGGAAVADDCGWVGAISELSAGYNLIEVAGNCTDFLVGTDTTGVDPQIGGLLTGPCAAPLADGTCLPVTALTAASPAIDAADCASTGATVDQRGFARPFDVLGAPNVADGCDIGTFEWTDLDGDGIEDGSLVFRDGFEDGTLDAWSASSP